MYVKLFSKMLDSSVWSESHATVRVWITLLLSMDRDGYAHFSGISNLARRANVTLQEATLAVNHLSGPDPDSEIKTDEGRRIKKIDGGFVVLNAQYYRNLKNREMERENTRLRVRKHRKTKKCNAESLHGVTDVLQNATSVSVSASVSNSITKKEKHEVSRELGGGAGGGNGFEKFWEAWPSGHRVEKTAVQKWFKKSHPGDELVDRMVRAIEAQKKSDKWLRGYIPNPTTWLNRGRWDDEVSTQEFTPPGSIHPDEVAMVLQLHRGADKDKKFWDGEFEKYLGINAKKACRLIGEDKWRKLTRTPPP